MIKVIADDDTEYEYRGEVRHVQPGEWFMTANGYAQVKKYPSSQSKPTSPERPIVYPIRHEHRFGRVVLQETGETRRVNTDEFFLDTCNNVCSWTDRVPSFGSYQILTPIRIEDEPTT